jgi:hypothetical protein
MLGAAFDEGAPASCELERKRRRIGIATEGDFGAADVRPEQVAKVLAQAFRNLGP